MIRTLVLALVVAGCAASGAGASDGAGPVATDRVDMPKSYRFAPETISVAVGSTVTWTNSDNFTHSVHFEGDAGSGLVAKPGEAVERQFTAPGTFAYVCTFHPTDMRGAVIVRGG